MYVGWFDLSPRKTWSVGWLWWWWTWWPRCQTEEGNATPETWFQIIYFWFFLQWFHKVVPQFDISRVLKAFSSTFEWLFISFLHQHLNDLMRPENPKSFKMLFSWAQNLLVRFESPGANSWHLFMFATNTFALAKIMMLFPIVSSYGVAAGFCQQAAVWGRHSKTKAGDCQLEHGQLVYWSRFPTGCCWSIGHSSQTQVPKLFIIFCFC